MSEVADRLLETAVVCCDVVCCDVVCCDVVCCDVTLVVLTVDILVIVESCWLIVKRAFGAGALVADCNLLPTVDVLVVVGLAAGVGLLRLLLDVNFLVLGEALEMLFLTVVEGLELAVLFGNLDLTAELGELCGVSFDYNMQHMKHSETERREDNCH